MTRSLRVVLILLGLSLLALALTGFSIYARLSYLWGLLLAISWVWSRLALRRVEFQRKTRTLRAQVGQLFEQQFEIRNEGKLPRLWLEVRDQSDLPASRGSRVVTLMGGGERQVYRVRTRLVERGVFSLGPTVLASGDLFGLFPVSRAVPAEGTLLVYPMMFEIESFPSPTGLLPGGEALRRRTHQITPNAAGVREYVPGDSMNRIHWPSTARKGELIVKEFELDSRADVWIFLDADQEVQAELPYSLPEHAVEAPWRPWEEVKLPPSTEEYAVSIAATLGRHFLRRGRAVGLMSAHSEGGPRVLSPDRGGRQLGKMLEILAPLHAGGDLSIAALAMAQAQHLTRGSTVILITPSAQEEVTSAADVLMRRGLRPAVVLLDAASFGEPSGTAELAGAIESLGVPVCRVANGDDLRTTLSYGASMSGTGAPFWRPTKAKTRMAGG